MSYLKYGHQHGREYYQDRLECAIDDQQRALIQMRIWEKTCRAWLERGEHWSKVHYAQERLKEFQWQYMTAVRDENNARRNLRTLELGYYPEPGDDKEYRRAESLARAQYEDEK